MSLLNQISHSIIFSEDYSLQNGDVVNSDNITGLFLLTHGKTPDYIRDNAHHYLFNIVDALYQDNSKKPDVNNINLLYEIIRASFTTGNLPVLKRILDNENYYFEKGAGLRVLKCDKSRLYDITNFFWSGFANPLMAEIFDLFLGLHDTHLADCVSKMFEGQNTSIRGSFIRVSALKSFLLYKDDIILQMSNEQKNNIADMMITTNAIDYMARTYCNEIPYHLLSKDFDTRKEYLSFVHFMGQSLKRQIGCDRLIQKYGLEPSLNNLYHLFSSTGDKDIVLSAVEQHGIRNTIDRHTTHIEKTHILDKISFIENIYDITSYDVFFETIKNPI